MNLTIIGYGFVGKALDSMLEKAHNTTIVDPAYTDNVIPRDSDGYVICLPTPSAEDESCDMSIIVDVLNSLPHKAAVLIKSTISLEGWKEITTTYPDLDVTFSPEFLTAANAIEDFNSQDTMLIGGGYYDFWIRCFDQCKKLTYVIKEPEELILAKYFRNSFLATKVAFFNQIYDLCKTTNIDYNEVRGLIAMDERIGNSHTEITEERGFGGYCFPKDTKAIIATSDLALYDLSILVEAIRYNDSIREETNLNNRT
jgi:UDPglucose 6-dehydrogenase